MISLEDLLNQDDGAEPGPSLREVVRRLTTPAQAGFVLTKQSLGELAASLELPVGFGERSQMLRGMFRAAAELGRLPALIEGLEARASVWSDRYAAWAADYPASAATWLTWQQVAAETLHLLADMAALARASGPRTAEPPSTQGPLPEPLDHGEEYAD